MLTQKQKAILAYLKDGDKTKSQIVNRFKSWHYANSSEHIGEILSRMVNKNTIVRIKKGVYSLNLQLRKEAAKDVENIENQLSLFK